MGRIAELKPLEHVALPGLSVLDTSGLVLVVGPNSSGKSQFLRDLYERLCGTPRALVVASEVRVRKLDLAPMIDVLVEEQLFERVDDGSGTAQLRPRTTYLGVGQALGQISSAQPQQWYGGYNPGDAGFHRRQSEFLNYFGRLLVTALFLDRRLVAVNQTGAYDHETQPPQHELHALYVDDEAKRALFQEIVSSFGKAVWPDASRGGTICLKVSEQGSLPSAEERLSPKRMSQFRAIESEGDGMKSYVATCIALLLGRRPVCLVDEPEMCLHPPQAYNLGRFIGRHGSSQDTVTFVATHSSHVLRGVIQTAPKLQIVRLVRSGATFSAHLVSADTLRAALEKPTVRAESILDGIFAQAVVVVEADTDRTVYQAVWESLQDDLLLDVHFAAVGGLGGIADTCKLYRTLRIPIAVVADLDVLLDVARLKQIVTVLAPREDSEGLVAEAAGLAARLRNVPPSMTPDVARENLRQLLDSNWHWENEDDRQLKTRLAELTNAIDRMRRLKKGGVAALPPELQTDVTAMLSKLADVGLYLVPVGELEEWLAGRIQASKASKWAWANAAAAEIRAMTPLDEDVWAFMRRVGGYLAGTQNGAPGLPTTGGT